MRPTARRQLIRCLVAGSTVLVLCSCPLPARASEPALAVWLDGGQGRSYALAEIERVTFESEMLQVVTIGVTDSYSLESIRRIDFHLGDWTGVENPEGAGDVLKALHLFQNQPNPFSPDTRIAFDLPHEGRAELRIYAVNGRLVRTLVEEQCAEGPYSVRWDGRDDAGRPVASGVYFCTLAAPGVDESRKMILLR